MIPMNRTRFTITTTARLPKELFAKWKTTARRNRASPLGGWFGRFPRHPTPRSSKVLTEFVTKRSSLISEEHETMTVKQILRVKPGHRVEVVAPELAEGELVDVLVLACGRQRAQHESVLAFIDSLPDGPRAFGTWDEYERHLRQERESWDR
jgi:hypothetical protein